jgi:hypothetical protein
MVALPLDKEALARSVNLAHRAGLRLGPEHFLAAGRLLLQAQAALPAADWLPWLDRFLLPSRRQVARYIRLARAAARDSASPLDQLWEAINGAEQLDLPF